MGSSNKYNNKMVKLRNICCCNTSNTKNEFKFRKNVNVTNECLPNQPDINTILTNRKSMYVSAGYDKSIRI